MLRSHRFITSARTLACCLVFALSWPALALADTARFEINAEPLPAALKAFAQQGHMQLLYEYALVQNVMGNRVIGVFEKHAALRELLRNTGLEAVFSSADGATIKPIRAVSTPSDSRKSSAKARDSRSEGKHYTPHAVDTDKYRDTQGPVTNNSGASPKDHDSPLLQEVIVTGSRLPTAPQEGPQEVQTYDRDQIDQSGQTTVSNFLSTLPAVSVAADDETEAGFDSTVRLRGLPEGTTLVLLDGRRLEDSGLTGGDFFNLDDIPMAAVQKIEVDENGSSAVYGSDAIAGVVNIILKKDFSGFAANTRYGSADDFGTSSTSVAMGKQWSRGGLSVIGSYETDGGLLRSERLLTASNDYRSFGGPDKNYPECSPGNVFSTNGAPLPGAPAGSGATYAAVTGPATSGKPPFTNFTYGTLNECALASGSALLPSRHREGILMNGHLEVSSNVELFTELMYTHVSQEVAGSQDGLFGVLGSQLFTVPASNPYNPFGETVGIADKLDSISSNQITDTNFFRPLVGVKGTLSGKWQWEVSAWQSSDWTQLLDKDELPNNAAIQNALDSSNLATALNPFVDGPTAPQSVLQSLYSDENIKYMSRDRSAEAFIRGPVLNLPAGPIDAVIGGDYVDSTLYQDLINNGVNPPNTKLTYQRKYQALFGEAEIPLIGRIGPFRSKLLTLTVAGRHDHYSDFGSANTDQFGLELRPLEGLLVRGSYANAFDAPTLPDLYGANTNVQYLITDPATGAGSIAPVIFGGNRNLRPMTGHSRTLGVVYSNPAVPGLQLAATQWNVVENNVIQSFQPQLIVDNETSFPGRVVRNSAGQIVEVIDTDTNFGSIDAAGIDYQLTYRRHLGGGVASIDVAGTETYRYRQALVPGGQAIESVSKAEDDTNWAPRWKGTAGASFERGALLMHVDGRYTGAYEDYDSVQWIGNFWIFDTYLRWAAGQSIFEDNRWFRNSYIEAGATNLFNRRPQFSNFESDFVGYDATQMSIVGRSLYVGVGMRW